MKNILRKMLRILPDKIYISLLYWKHFKCFPDLKNPKTFNEKLQWLKLYDRKPEYTAMVDKIEVKNWVARRIGEEYIIPTLGVWDDAEQIDFDALPNQFVLKCNHDGGGSSVVICRDKTTFDRQAAIEKLNKCLKNNGYWYGREWPYKNVKPRIIAEQYMEDGQGNLNDYKFMCFNSEVRCSFVCTDRFSEEGLHVTFFDRDWNVMPFERNHPSKKSGLPKPMKHETMVKLAKTLSKDIQFVRVDFYEVDGKVYFGELTLYPGSGLEPFQPKQWDLKMGSWLQLPKE